MWYLAAKVLRCESAEGESGPAKQLSRSGGTREEPRCKFIAC